jgi:hypothetical protein
MGLVFSISLSGIWCLGLKIKRRVWSIWIDEAAEIRKRFLQVDLKSVKGLFWKMIIIKVKFTLYLFYYERKDIFSL